MKVVRQSILAAFALWTSMAALAITDVSPPRLAPLALATEQASSDALYLEGWIRRMDDAQGRPFAIVDKKAARIYVFAAGGRLAGTSSTLLGLARGDIPVPGAGEKDPALLLPYERKTPAGRFASVPGRNLNGEAVVWVDYRTGIAIHRVRPGRSQAQRLRRLTTPESGDKRVSLGCVVVPEAFFSDVVLPTLGQTAGMVYVLPEDSPVQAMFRDPAELAHAGS